ncbi:sigma-70 family RNA polymerase sigma factor [Corallococcus sp. AB030]|uniref:RNA polymerase sigma factor n=1 Tax=Corallococcus TaxID=83461 RepID=UPI000EECBAA9|nr:sigma-70 family RNA polymerase sigma factor [Corallococcus sp. AB030]RKI09907.1 sigma-70 family RNA polymerase sigma factor [Corallococcus sp. AB030]
MSLPATRAEELLARFRQQRPEAVRLAELVCLATRIEHGLLREARLHLAPDLDAGAEADLWFSPLVESWSARAFVLSPAIAALLRDALFEERDRAERAWALIQRLHAHVPPIIAVEERVTWLAHARGPNALGDIESALRTVLRTMLHDTAQGLGVARWALRALPRLPALVREMETARLLTFGAAVRLGLRAFPGGSVSMPSQDVRWLLPGPDRESLFGLRMEWDSTGLTFLHGLDGDRGHALLVPDTRPLLLEVVWLQEGQEQRRLIEAGDGARVPIPAKITALQVRTVAGDEFEVVTPVPGEEPELPRYLDPAVWQSCARLPDREQPTTAYFIDSSAMLTAASAFPNERPGARIEVDWNGERWWATLREKDTEAGYALLELLEGTSAAHAPTGIPFIAPNDPVPSPVTTWVAYAMSADGPVWFEGTVEPDAPHHEQTFRATRASASHDRPPIGAPLFMGGLFLVGHFNGWDGQQVRLGSGSKLIRERSALHQTPSQPHPALVVPIAPTPPREEDSAFDADASEEAARHAGLEARLDELRELIRNQSDIDSLVLSQLPPLLLGSKVASRLLPAGTRKATISDMGEGKHARLSLDLRSLELENTAACDATIDLDKVQLTLRIDDSSTPGRKGDEEVEAIVSLKVLARIGVVTEVPEDGVEMITSVYLSGIEEIAVVAVHKQPGTRSRGSPKRRDAKEGAQRTAAPAPIDVFGKYMGLIVRRLGRSVPCSEETASDAAIDAIFAYLRAPERHDPAKASLETYLFQIARRVAQDRMRSESARLQREQHYVDIAAIQAGNPKGRMDSSAEAEAIMKTLVSRGTLSDAKDIATLRLFLEGENSTETFAEAMGLKGLPKEELRREVKRYRDRLMKRLSRVGEEDSNLS